jgi:hypothetical protein
MDYQSVLEVLGNESFGVLAGASTSEIVVYARNFDTSIGDLFLIPSDRGGERVYIFRMTNMRMSCAGKMKWNPWPRT